MPDHEVMVCVRTCDRFSFVWNGHVTDSHLYGVVFFMFHMSWETQHRAAVAPPGMATTLTACNDIFSIHVGSLLAMLQDKGNPPRGRTPTVIATG